MSHIVPIELQVRNLKALELCLGQFGAELRLNQKQFAEYYGLKPCDAAIHVNGAKYEIGLKKNADGSYTLLCDFWSSGGLTQKFGQNGDKLKNPVDIQKPDFSGTWTPDVAADTTTTNPPAGGGGRGGGGPMTVKQTATK